MHGQLQTLVMRRALGAGNGHAQATHGRKGLVRLLRGRVMENEGLPDHIETWQFNGAGLASTEVLPGTCPSSEV